MAEVTRREAPRIETAGLEAFDGAEIEIESIFKRKLSALRHLRRSERPHALRAAREERLLALKALRDRRAGDRRARHARQRLLVPAPS